MKFCPHCRQNYDDDQIYCLSHGTRLCRLLHDTHRLVGRELNNKFHIDALVAEGGMGAVYCAHHLNFECPVAFKILLPHLAANYPDAVRRFENEAKMAFRIKHDNIVGVYDAGRATIHDQGQSPYEISYIAMEWLDGRTLEEEISRDAPLSFERILELLEQIAAALDAAHARRIVHRDLKPANVMLIRRPEGTDQIKVVDFGIAKAIDQTEGSPVSLLGGTPHYGSPEQWDSKGTIGKQSDVYSLGVMLFEMLTGRHPFDAPNRTELISKHSIAAIPPLREYLPEAPSALERLLNKMLAKDPDDRPSPVSIVPEMYKRAILSPPNPGSGPLPLTRTAHEFDVLVLDARGTVARRYKGTAQSFSEYLGGAVKLEMVEIPGGTFLMGSPDKEKERFNDEGPQHRVTVSSFWMGKHAVTQAQWRSVARLEKVRIELNPDPSYFKGADLPVENVSWEEAVEFCERLKKKSGKDYRLPTEAEWEYACRAGAITPFAFGETIITQIVNCDGAVPYASAPEGILRRKTTPVGSLGVANGFGLFDMHGNVWEWCQDWYEPYSSTEAINPQGPDNGQRRARRGGAWLDRARYCRSAVRSSNAPDYRDFKVGFRVVASGEKL